MKTKEITRADLRVLSAALGLLDSDEGINNKLSFLKSCSAIFDADKYEAEYNRVKKMNKPEDYDSLLKAVEPIFGKDLKDLSPDEKNAYNAYQALENSWAQTVNELMSTYSEDTVSIQISEITEAEFNLLFSKDKPQILERDENGKPLKDSAGNFLYIKKKQNEKISQRGKAVIAKYFVK